MLRSDAAASRTLTALHALLFVGLFALALVAAWLFPQLDRALNPTSVQPGLVSYLGVGLSVLGLSALLLGLGLRRVLPRSAVFLVSMLGYSGLLILVKFGIGPSSVYAYLGEPAGYQYLTDSRTFPIIAAATAVGYGTAFFMIYAIFHTRVQMKLGLGLKFERRAVQLLVVFYVVAIAGLFTLAGLNAATEYLQAILYNLGALLALALALSGAIALCALAFREAADQAILVRNVAVLSSFAWIGLAFIAAYHILWFVFMLTLVSLWPLRYSVYK